MLGSVAHLIYFYILTLTIMAVVFDLLRAISEY